MAEPKETALSPQRLMQIQSAALASRALAAAFDLDIFSLLAEGHEKAEDVATAAGASLRGVRMLLDGLSALEIIEKKEGRYRLFPESRSYLTRSSPDYIGALMAGDHLWESWSRLTQAVRTGLPVHNVVRRERAEKFFPILIKSLHVLNREPARRLAGVLGAGSGHAGLRVLDVGCGSAVWSLAIAEADRKARVTAQDFPAVLKETRELVARAGVGDRFDYLPGEFREVSFGRDAYDLALLGNIVHSEGEQSSRLLFRRLHDALRPKGRLVILDFLTNEDRTGPAPAVLFALNMLANTENGDTFALSEYRSWLNEAGFDAIELADIGEHVGTDSPAIIATRM